MIPALVRNLTKIIPAALSLISAFGCPTEPERPDQVPAPTPEPTPDPTPPVPEECNGLDDDGDGIVDNGFDDSDADGDADCVDTSCAPMVDAPLTVPNPACTHLPPGVSETYDVVVTDFLQEPDPGFGCGVLSNPLFVLQATDDNNDGLVDDLDDLDVVTYDDCPGGLTSAIHGVLFEPAAGRVTSMVPGTALLGPIPDADGDGRPEFAGMSPASSTEILYQFRAMSGDGGVTWETAVPYDSSLDGTGYWYPGVGDLDGNGVAEIAWWRRIFNARTGEVLAQASVMPGARSTQHTVITDLDLDGSPEILTSDGAFDAGGALLWTLPSQPGWGHAMPVQADGDGLAEVVVVSGGGLWILNELGEITASAPLDDWEAAPPCLADVDGDGQPEVVGMVWRTAQITDLRALRLDGTELWSQEVFDPSGSAGCSAFDFDGDGRFEVLYQDQEEMTIRDGPTGEVLYRYDDLISATDIEYPVAVDLDKDGSAEIIFVVPATSTGPGGVAVLSSPRRLWMAGADAWPAWEYRIDNVNVDGSVPLQPPATWLTHNSVHAAPLRHRPFPNLRPVVTGSCVSGCLDHSQVRLSFAIANEGLIEVPSGVGVVLRREGDLSGQPLWSGTLDAALSPGEVSAAWEYVSTRGELGMCANFDIAKDHLGPAASGAFVGRSEGTCRPGRCGQDLSMVGRRLGWRRGASRGSG